VFVLLVLAAHYIGTFLEEICQYIFPKILEFDNWAYFRKDYAKKNQNL